MNNNLNNENKNKDYAREINLDDLYDGAINNTVVIDPVTNNEVLLNQKKSNKGIILLLIFILLLLGLYYFYTKSNFNNKNRSVAPKTTTTTTKIVEQQHDNGNIKCSYASSNDSYEITVSYEGHYEDKKLINSKYNFSLISKQDQLSSDADKLKEEYENYYINNASLSGYNVNFESKDKLFSITTETTYKIVNFDLIKAEEGKTELIISPKLNDTYETVKEAYTNKGYTCDILKEE